MLLKASEESRRYTGLFHKSKPARDSTLSPSATGRTCNSTAGRGGKPGWSEKGAPGPRSYWFSALVFGALPITAWKQRGVAHLLRFPSSSLRAGRATRGAGLGRAASPPAAARRPEPGRRGGPRASGGPAAGGGLSSGAPGARHSHRTAQPRLARPRPALTHTPAPPPGHRSPPPAPPPDSPLGSTARHPARMRGGGRPRPGAGVVPPPPPRRQQRVSRPRPSGRPDPSPPPPPAEPRRGSTENEENFGTSDFKRLY